MRTDNNLKKALVGKLKLRTGNLATVAQNHIITYPTPSSLNYNWSYGSLVGLFFAIQIVTGIIVAMYYSGHVSLAFASVEKIMVEVYNGFIIRYSHANGASMVFILIYLHIARGLYYKSYVAKRGLWISGVVLFILMMATAFIGYVLPWGQMSFWGATVITSLVTAVPLVGEDIAYLVWGGFSVGNATLNRFFSLHYLLPFILTALIMTHLVILHTSGSSDPRMLSVTESKLPFTPYFVVKDRFVFIVTAVVMSVLVFFLPNLLGHSDNFTAANAMVTPAHIVPEWYFTPFYAILRACPNKLGGAIGMFAALLILLALIGSWGIKNNHKKGDYPYNFAGFSTAHRVAFWMFFSTFLILMFLGSRAAAEPYVSASKAYTILYFVYVVVQIIINTNAAALIFRTDFFVAAAIALSIAVLYYSIQTSYAASNILAATHETKMAVIQIKASVAALQANMNNNTQEIAQIQAVISNLPAVDCPCHKCCGCAED